MEWGRARRAQSKANAKRDGTRQGRTNSIHGMDRIYEFM